MYIFLAIICYFNNNKYVERKHIQIDGSYITKWY